MIVKNTPDYHQSHKKQESSLHSVSNTNAKGIHSHFPHNKPYFLQGLEFARNYLLHLRKQKLQLQDEERIQQQSIQYSPIRKNTKISHDTINEQLEQQSFNEKNKNSKEAKGELKMLKNKIPKMAKLTQSGQIYENEQQQQQSKKNLKYRQQYPLHLAESSQQHESMNQKYIQISKINQTQQQPQQIDAHKFTNNKQCLNPLYNRINQVGNQLQETYNELQTYQLIFDNLCDFLRANQHIYSKNQRLKRQALRLQEEKEQIMVKIEKVRAEQLKIEENQRKSAEFIAKNVEKYISEVCAYNRNIQIKPTVRDQQIITQQNETGQESEIDQNEIYGRDLRLNFKRIKQKYDQRMKKKGLLEPKKLQKGVSFQQQIDVISKYYQSQLTNI